MFCRGDVGSRLWSAEAYDEIHLPPGDVHAAAFQHGRALGRRFEGISLLRDRFEMLNPSKSYSLSGESRVEDVIFTQGEEPQEPKMPPDRMRKSSNRHASREVFRGQRHLGVSRRLWGACGEKRMTPRSSTN